VIDEVHLPRAVEIADGWHSITESPSVPQNPLAEWVVKSIVPYVNRYFESIRVGKGPSTAEVNYYTIQTPSNNLHSRFPEDSFVFIGRDSLDPTAVYVTEPTITPLAGMRGVIESLYRPEGYFVESAERHAPRHISSLRRTDKDYLRKPVSCVIIGVNPIKTLPTI
jgi:hypothetical protein